MQKLAEKLKELRKSAGFNQTIVANALGINYFTLGKWEQGRAEPSAVDLVRLADYFDVTVDFLLGRTDEFNVVQNGNKETEQNSELERKILAVVREYPKGYEEEALRSVQNGLILAEHKASENQTKRTLKNIIKRVTK